MIPWNYKSNSKLILYFKYCIILHYPFIFIQRSIIYHRQFYFSFFFLYSLIFSYIPKYPDLFHKNSINSRIIFTHSLRIINIQYLIFVRIYALAVIERSLMKQEEVSYVKGGRSMYIRICIGWEEGCSWSFLMGKDFLTHKSQWREWLIVASTANKLRGSLCGCIN